MKETVRSRLEKAARAIQAARVEFDADLSDFALSDAYYALFYVAEALLLESDQSYSSHGAVHGAFGREFARTGTIDPIHHRRLIDAFLKRNEADYTVGVEVSERAAEEMIGWAEEFLAAAREYLEGSA